MIKLIVKNGQPHLFKRDIVHFKVLHVAQPRDGVWEVVVDDITPLPGFEPPGYACWNCGIIEPAKADGGLPEGWMIRGYGDGINYPKGQHFFCGDEWCQKSKMCRLCGCNDEHACDPPCSWIEEDRCSGCEA